MEISKLDLKNFFFISILVLLGFVMLQLFSPFLNIIIIALVIVQLFYPFYRRIHKTVRNTGLASLLSTLITLLFVVLPIVLVILLAISEISVLANNTEFNSLFAALYTALDGLLVNINTLLASIGIDYSFTLPSLNEISDGLITSTRDSVVPIATGLISVSVNSLFQLFILFITLVYLFVEYERLPMLLSRISPLDDELDKLLFKKFTLTTRAVIQGSFVVAVAQATAVSAALLLLGVGAPVLLWVIMVLFSLVPVGSGVVWVPISLAMIISGVSTANPAMIAQGVALLVYSGIIINVIDTSLRPRVMRNTVSLHPLIIIFSALGGIALFGPLGLLYGPLISVFFTSLMDVYTEKFTDKQELLRKHYADGK